MRRLDFPGGTKFGAERFSTGMVGFPTQGRGLAVVALLSIGMFVLMLVPASEAGATGSAAGVDAVRRVHFVSLAPSSYTNRHDSMRAGFGIYLLLQEQIDTHDLPIELAYYDGVALLDDPSGLEAVLSSADAYIVGGSTWAQGPSQYVRRFFELGGGVDLTGSMAAAWATSGGAHTGGEEVVRSILRSMAGQGAQVFTLGQKQVVFTTDERLVPPKPGDFSTFDLWYMDQFARMIAVQVLSRNDRARARALQSQLQVSPFYYRGSPEEAFPPPPETLERYQELASFLNAAADPRSGEWSRLSGLLEGR